MIWLLCFANIFLYVVRIGIDQWSTVYAFQELKLSKAVAIQGFTLFEAGATTDYTILKGDSPLNEIKRQSAFSFAFPIMAPMGEATVHRRELPQSNRPFRRI